MARKPQTFDVSVLNIVTHPHDTETYQRLFNTIFLNDWHTKILGEIHGMIGTINQIDPRDESEGYYGSLFKFTEIDPDGAWLNLRRREEASPKELAQVSIPNELRSNFSSIPYAFFPKTHRLYFATRSAKGAIGAKTAQRMFTQLFKKALTHLEMNNHELNVHIVQASDGLKQILGLQQLRSLEITISRPNPDGPGDLAAELLGGLDAQNATKGVYSLIAQKGQSLKPSQKAIELANFALENGNVAASGKNEKGQTKHLDTEKHPKRIRQILEDGAVLMEEFIQLAKRLASKLK